MPIPQADAPSQTDRVLLALRNLIYAGEFPAGTRLTELGLVNRLGASRTPVRHALAQLAHDGLLDELPTGGFRVRGFPIQDVWDTFELRSVLEGTAARMAGERLDEPASLDRLAVLLDAMDGVEERARENVECYFEALADFFDLNEDFHGEIRRLSKNEPLIRAVNGMLQLPFTDPRCLVFSYITPHEKVAVIAKAQVHHHQIFEAIAARSGARAEALMREHALMARHTLAAALADTSRSRNLPSLSLLDLSAADL